MGVRIMDASTSPRFEPMTTGVLLDRAFRLYTGNFPLMLGIAATAYVPFYLIMLVIEASIGGNLPGRSGSLSMLIFQVVFMILWASIAFPIASGATTYAISERYLGNEVGIGEAMRRGLTHFWSLSIAQITATIRVMFGFLLLIVPGILWMLSYALIVPVILIEGQKAIPSLRRSRDLVKGYRGKVFCILLVVNFLQVVLTAGVSVISGIFFSGESAGNGILASALNNLLSIFLTPLGIIAAILLYYDMRIRKEGFDLEMLSRAMASEAQTLAPQPTPTR
jgi:hypothetical protein